MKHNYLSSLRRTLSAVLLLLVSTLSWAQNYYDFKAGGIYYHINADGTSVEMTFSRRGYTGDIVIPSTVEYKGKTYSVTSIGYRAFSGCTSLASISLPEGVTRIGEGAFSGCTSLASISLPRA